MELKGYMARNWFGDLHMYYCMPKRHHSRFDGDVIMELAEDLFPEVTWENSPVEVTIKIEKAKHNG